MTEAVLEPERAVLREIRLPLREPFRISTGTMTTKRILLLELEQDGLRSWSECAALAEPIYIPDTVDTCWTAITQWLAPRVLGGRFTDPAEVWPALDAGLRGHRKAKAALEMGCWDLAARQRNLPLARVLGGTRTRVETGISLGIESSPDSLARRVETAVDQGYRRIKVKIERGRDHAYLTAAMEAAAGTPVMADANSAYDLSHVDELRRLDDLGLLMIEQPLGWDDLAGHAVLQRELRTPVCLDECVATPRHAETMTEQDAGRILNIKPGRVGGFRPSIEIHDHCRARDVPVWCGGMLESGIGRAHNVALASLPGFTMAGDLSPSARYWERDVVRPEWAMTEPGYLDVPLATPGMGVQVDADWIDDLTVRSVALTRP